MQMMPEIHAYMSYAGAAEVQQQAQIGAQQQQAQINTYSDLSDFNTLATVAAQSPHLNQEIQYRPNTAAITSQIMKVNFI
jgi:hypothetical protein